jgi:hypothetical protein
VEARHVDEWGERISTLDDALLVAAWIDEELTDSAALAELDDALLVLEARADDPGPFTLVRAAIRMRLQDLERT